MKRFADTERWRRDAWFCALPSQYKLLSIYLFDTCDNAGVWEVNQKNAEFECGFAEGQIDWGGLLDIFNQDCGLMPRLIQINERKWWLPKFLIFHWSNKEGKMVLNGKVPWQNQVIKLIRKHDISSLVDKYYPGWCIEGEVPKYPQLCPSLEQIKALAQAQGQEEANLRLFHSYWNGKGWKKDGVPQWDLEKLLAEWLDRGAVLAAERRASKAAVVQESRSLQEQINDAETQILTLRTDTVTVPGMPVPVIRTESQQKIRSLKLLIQELKAKQGPSAFVKK